MSRLRDRLRNSPVLITAISICTAHFLLSVVPRQQAWVPLASNLLQLAAAVLAGCVCLNASRRSADFSRTIWRLVAAGFGIWSVTQAMYSYQAAIAASDHQVSWTQFLYRLYRAPWVMALLIVPGEEDEPGPDWPQRLDFAQVFILFAFFYYCLYSIPGFLQQLSPLASFGFLELSDLENWALFAAFLARAALSRRRGEGMLYLRLVPYLLSYAAASSFFNYADVHWPGVLGTWPEAFFTVSFTAGSLLAGTWRPAGTEAGSGGGDLAPAVYWTPAVLPLLILLLAIWVAPSSLGVSFAAAFGSVGCFGARLLITLYRRQQIVEALRLSETRYANLVEMAPDAIFVHQEGVITFANRATARALGFSEVESVLGHQIFDARESQEGDEAEPVPEDLGGGVLRRRRIYVRPDGARVHVETLGMPLPPLRGEEGPQARLVMARDVTEAVRSAAERDALIRVLEAKNAELERFTYTVSHDLRSPLITVSGFLGHVEDAAVRGDMAGLRADLARITRAVSKMDELLRDLLKLSRVGHTTETSAPVAFHEICREAVALVQGRIARQGVAVVIEPDLPAVRADRRRLVEAMQNLLDNACKFMGAQAEPRITIGFRGDRSDPTFFVKDNGVGIEPQHHKTIFGLFDKLDPKAEGTGIGLAITKRVIELHGGRLWVESSGGGSGATFCFTLPPAEDGAATPL